MISEIVVHCKGIKPRIHLSYKQKHSEGKNLERVSTGEASKVRPGYIRHQYTENLFKSDGEPNLKGFLMCTLFIYLLLISYTY